MFVSYVSDFYFVGKVKPAFFIAKEEVYNSFKGCKNWPNEFRARKTEIFTRGMWSSISLQWNMVDLFSFKSLGTSSTFGLEAAWYTFFYCKGGSSIFRKLVGHFFRTFFPPIKSICMYHYYVPGYISLTALSPKSLASKKAAAVGAARLMSHRGKEKRKHFEKSLKRSLWTSVFPHCYTWKINSDSQRFVVDFVKKR